MTKDPRRVAVDILLRVFRDRVYSHIAVSEALDANMAMSKKDRSFVKYLAEGTIERTIELDYILDLYASVPVGRMKPAIKMILRSAVFQMKYMNSVPNEAACNEAVKLAQQLGFYSLKGFVNGVLRNIARNIDRIPYPDPSDSVRYLSVRYSMPEWIVEYFIEEYGTSVTERILKKFLKRAPLTVRLRTDRDTYHETVDRLLKQDIEISSAPYIGYAININKIDRISALPEFHEGLIYVQDVSSMLVAEAADVRPGDYVIDMCAAPGGKSLHIADLMKGYGMVEARDISDEKVRLITENINRSNMINIKAVRMDATVYDKISEDKADVVIADVPCSGLGVIGRKPDIKYRTTEETIEELIPLQRKILHNAASYVRPGGVIIYSTCTLGSRENLDNVRWFEENYPFETESLDPYIPSEIRRHSTSEGYLQLIPGVHNCDGFFIARLRKKK